MTASRLPTLLDESATMALVRSGAVDDLARRQGRLYFASSAWVDAWRAVFEPRAALLSVVSGDPEAPSGILLASRLRRRLHHRVPLSLRYVGLAGAGRGAADFTGPLAASLDDSMALLARLAEDSPGAPISLEGVPRELADRVVTELGGEIVSTRSCPGVDLVEGEALPAKTRKNLRRRERLLDEAGVTARWCQQTGELLEGLEELRRLHLARWEAKGGAGLFDRDRMRFLTALAHAADGDDGMRILVLERADATVGALVGFQFGETFCSYKTGWAPEFARLGPGMMMHHLAMERSRALGHRRYEFLRGTESHKTTLGGIGREIATVTVANGLRGRILLARDRLQAGRER